MQGTKMCILSPSKQLKRLTRFYGFHVLGLTDQFPSHTEFFRQSSSTSKLEVSVGLLTSGMYGASHVRMSSQFIPEKKGWLLKSSMPFCPSRCSRELISLRIRSLASSDTSDICVGNWNLSCKDKWEEDKMRYSKK